MATPFQPPLPPARGPARAWRYGRRGVLMLDRPRIMAILNVTPDSFSDGGRLSGPGSVVAAARSAVEAGAGIVDIGGESTRPGAGRVGAGEQIARVVPGILAIRGAGLEVPISVDTTLAEVARAGLEAGADAINDVSAGLEDPGMLGVIAGAGAGVVLMHRLAPPGMDSYSDRYREAPRYGDVVGEVGAFLRARAEAAIAAGIASESICIDPGLGFGKSVGQNMELIWRTGELAAIGWPVLSGLSRKSFVGRVSLDRESTPAERLGGTLALSVAHLLAGAAIFRVHDVAEHAEVLRAACALRREGSTPQAEGEQAGDVGVGRGPAAD